MSKRRRKDRHVAPVLPTREQPQEVTPNTLGPSTLDQLTNYLPIRRTVALLRATMKGGR